MSSVREFEGTDPNYQYLEFIDSGSFGRVTKVRRKRDGKILACKSIDLSNMDTTLLEAINREIMILQTLGGCISCIQWDEDIAVDTRNKRLHLHMEYCNSGTLKNIINQRAAAGDPLDQRAIMGIFEDLVNGLQAFHRAGIIHRDIKPGNILLHLYQAGEYVPDFKRSYPHQTINAYFADFGLGKFSTGAHNPEGSIGSGNCGTEVYMAPESVRLDPTYGQKSDIFSLGCTMFELCELRRPYNSRFKTSVPEMQGPYSAGLKKLITDCMAINPSQRPDTETLYRRFTILDAGRKSATGDFLAF